MKRPGEKTFRPHHLLLFILHAVLVSEFLALPLARDPVLGVMSPSVSPRVVENKRSSHLSRPLFVGPASAAAAVDPQDRQGGHQLYFTSMLVMTAANANNTSP